MTLRRMLVLTAIVVALFGTRCADGFRQDEMDCEQAMNDLASCCPGFVADQASCAYQGAGCSGGEPVVAPVLTVDVSKCILGKSCDDLRTPGGVCDRAVHLPYVPESSTTPQPVCP